MIKRSRKLITDYVNKSRCLCLVVITMTGMNPSYVAELPDNIENQEGPQIARQFDEKGKRTIGISKDKMTLLTLAGVLTKADLIPPGEEGQWLKILENQPKGAHHLLHGYYVTRQLSTPQREAGDIRPSRAKEIECDFFQEPDTIWRKVDQTRLGTWNLSNALSCHLAKMIKERYSPAYPF